MPQTTSKLAVHSDGIETEISSNRVTQQLVSPATIDEFVAKAAATCGIAVVPVPEAEVGAKAEVDVQAESKPVPVSDAEVQAET